MERGSVTLGARSRLGQATGKAWEWPAELGRSLCLSLKGLECHPPLCVLHLGSSSLQPPFISKGDPVSPTLSGHLLPTCLMGLTSLPFLRAHQG